MSRAAQKACAYLLGVPAALLSIFLVTGAHPTGQLPSSNGALALLFAFAVWILWDVFTPDGGKS